LTTTYAPLRANPIKCMVHIVHSLDFNHFGARVFIELRNSRIYRPNCRHSGSARTLPNPQASYHTMSGPSGSYEGLAPICSTLRFQSLPRK